MNKKVLKFLKWFIISFLSLIMLFVLIIYLNRDNICRSAIDGINEKIKSPLIVKHVELTFWETFPNLSIDLNDVFIAGLNADKPSSDTLLYSKLIRLKLNPFDLLKENYEFKSIVMNSGKIQLKVDKNGNENYDILKPGDSDDDKFNLKLKSVFLNQMKFSYENASTKQYYHTNLEQFKFNGDFNEKKYKVKLAGDLFLNNLRSGQLNLIENKKVKIDLYVDVDRLKNTINIPFSVVDISGLPFSIKGFISKNDYTIKVKTKEVQFKKLIESFNHNVTHNLASLKGSGEVYFDLLISGDYNKTKPPKVKCLFGIKDGALIDPIKKSHIKNIDVSGNYSNDTNDVLLIDKIKCVTRSGPFDAKIKISDFNKPHLEGHTNGRLHLGILSEMIPLSTIDELNGKLSINTDFDFIINLQKGEGPSIFINKIDGLFKLDHAYIKFIGDAYSYENINADFLLSKKKIELNKITLNVGQSDIYLSGLLKNVDQYFSNGILDVNLKMKSKQLNVADFYDTTSLENSKRTFILPSDIKGRIDLAIDDFNYFGHSFKMLDTDLLIDNRNLSISNFKANHAEASYHGDVFLKENMPELIEIQCNLSSNKIKISPLMKEWDNFYQTMVDYKSLDGDFKTKINLSALYDLRKGLIYDELESELDLKAKNIKLHHVELLNDIGDYLNNPIARITIGNENVNYIRSNLNDIKIPKIENKISIKDSKLIIPSMLVSSTFLDINMEGEHAFSNDIDYLFSFHLKDVLKKRNKDEFGEIIDDNRGFKVFLRVHGNVDNPIIEWDKKRQKKNAAIKRKEEKKEIKSMLKKDFGLYKNDTTVKEYIQKEEVEDQIEIDFDLDEKEDTLSLDSVKKKKPSKVQSKINKLKTKLNKLGEEMKEEEEEEIDFD